IDLTVTAVTTGSESAKSVTASGTLGLAPQIHFGGDGPNPPSLSFPTRRSSDLTFDGGLAGGDFVGTQDSHDTNVSATIATEDFSTAIALVYNQLIGTDGVGATTVSYALSLHSGFADGSASGLTHATNTIYLYNI